MIILNDVDPTVNPFNDFIKNYGMWIAIGVAALVLIVILILFFVSSKKKQTKQATKTPVLFDSNIVIEALGGKENISNHSLNGSRIVISLNDSGKVNETTLKENSVISIIKMSNKITLLVEGDSKEFYNRVFQKQ